MTSSRKYNLLLVTLYFFILSLLPATANTVMDNAGILREIIDFSEEPVNVILLDPGHGGKDLGCSGNHLHEKDIALEIALEIGSQIQILYPVIEVRYTRTVDVFVPLHQRVAMANTSEVDLFISIHCNALKDKSAHGIETYVMGLHTSAENLEISKRENAVVSLEDLSGFEEGYDPYSAEGHILMSMMQQNTLGQSIQLAQFTQEALVENTRFRNRGVKQAGFVVLRKVLVPSILIEAGFITNPRDAKMLQDGGENVIAKSIVEGLGKYIAHYREQ